MLLRSFPAFRLFDLGPRVSLLFVFAFALRAAQTRRWIAGPMAAAHLAGAFLTMVLNHMARRVDGWSVGEALPYVVGGAIFGVAWCAVNALALGAGSLLDRRRVRRT